MVAVIKGWSFEGCQQLQEGEAATGKRWRDNFGSIMVVGCRTSNGVFLRVKSSPVALRGRKQTLCIPAGEGGKVWKVFAEMLASTVGVGVAVKTPLQVLEEGGHVLMKKSYWEAVVGVEEEPGVASKSDGKKEHCVKVILTIVGTDLGWRQARKHLKMVGK